MGHVTFNNRIRHLSWVRDMPDHRDKMLQYSRLKSVFLPPVVDLRATWPRIEDQGDIGSCTANSSSSVFEFLYLKASLPQPELSRLFLYFSTRVWVEGRPPSEDSGAQLRDVMKALAKYGICQETTWPYDPSLLASEPSNQAKLEALKHVILSYHRCDGIRAIKSCLAEGYPLAGGFSVPESMQSDAVAKTGVIPFPGPDEQFLGGHAVAFVGYDDNKDAFTIANSWGPEWGDKGFGYLPYEYVTEGLADDFWTIRSGQL